MVYSNLTFVKAFYSFYQLVYVIILPECLQTLSNGNFQGCSSHTPFGYFLVHNAIRELLLSMLKLKL